MSSDPFAGYPVGHYGAILADPPWTFRTHSDEGKGRSPERHYQCMNLDDIKRLPVARLAKPNCALFLWTIDTHLPQALEVVKAWGFEYKTVGFYWVKTTKSDTPFTGMGYWTRANPEQLWLAERNQCLLSTLGRPTRQDCAVRRLIMAERREHSRKPDEIYERIERLVEGPYIELFGRQRRDGWDVWGNECDKFSQIEEI